MRSSPYDEYVTMLQRAGLDRTNLGGQWTRASESALRNAAPMASPFAESGYFAAGPANGDRVPVWSCSEGVAW